MPKTVQVRARGVDLLRDPLLNKSSAFTREERRAFALEGLLPEAVSSMELQAERVYANIVRKSDPLERYIGLAALQDRNEHLFYRVLLDHLEEFLPIVYTPTVGQASREYSHIFRRGRGLWLTPSHRGRIRETLDRVTETAARLIVVTDNEAILGIGDQGAGGIVIPIGKLAIYCAAAGIDPAETLPISLDVGTNNKSLLDDDLYLGYRKERLTGESYFEFLEEFVDAVAALFPKALLQWEDFRKSHAFDLLETYRHRVLSFNDDIQGTGATALAGLLAASRVSGRPLSEERIVVVGGGAAGIGIAAQLRHALEAEGVEGERLSQAIAVLDSGGLIVDDRERLDRYKRPFAWPAALASSTGLATDRGLLEVVRRLRPTALIGTSGQPGLFSQEIVTEMGRGVERPVIFPFSNPTQLAEARPQDLLSWTDGRALIATGSPFDPVEHGGREFRFGQGNNAFIFPGIGLGALVVGAKVVDDRMFAAAAAALSNEVTAEELDRGQLYPSTSRLREVTATVATAMVETAEAGDRAAAERVRKSMWEPEYPTLVPV